MERKYRDRLNKLADLLDADAANKKGIRFNLGLLAFVDKKDDPLSCGTQACAIGLAALSGKFNRAGMRVIMDSHSPTNSITIGYTKTGGDKDIRWEWEAAAKGVFGLTLGEVQWLFTEGAYAYTGRMGASAERAVAARLRRMAAGTARMPTKYAERAW